ncbi:MAG: 4Fe-4S ferredoxin [Deltaproteobacteria bacterium GWC2_42_11]|nr:MAG: 4Fe-4S ferredoxin [Deltaproteobacteria bacterium GWC2_42_11]HBO84355.1 4Fe-4S ferredoxin [Deltaproteobacteria bacterium]
MSEEIKETGKEDASGNETRRNFLKDMGTAALAGAAALMTDSDDAEAKSTWAEWFQKNWRLMTDEEKKDAIARLETRYSEEYGKKVTVDGSPAMKSVLFGYALNIQKCIGCRRCVYACVKENNQSRHDTEIQWIRVIRMEKQNFLPDDMNKGYPPSAKEPFGIQVGGNAHKPAGVTLEGQHYYQPELVPEKDAFYFPIQCMQCEKPPCVKVCPVRTTYRDPDGIVVIDYNWCIGCRMCMAACPYWARRFNWGDPNLPKEEMNPNTHYLGNRPRMRGVVEKCTFCIQRSRKGRYTACVEVCPVGARKFGNLFDPNSEVRQILERKKVFRLKAELNTYPKFFYFID